MALERSIMMDDGVVRRYHKIINVQHIADQASIVEVVSYQFNENDGTIGCHSTFSHEFDDGLSYSEAYEWIAGLDFFEEYTSDAESEIVELNDRLNQANAIIINHESTIETTTNALIEASNKLDMATSVLTDEQALTIPMIFDEWEVGKFYAAGTRVQYNNELYRCLQNHTSEAGWNPNGAPSLWTYLHLSEIDPDLVEEWTQPDSTNPYMAGAKVTHNGTTWISTVDNNVWEPGVYGWDEYINE